MLRYYSGLSMTNNSSNRRDMYLNATPAATTATDLFVHSTLQLWQLSHLIDEAILATRDLVMDFVRCDATAVTITMTRTDNILSVQINDDDHRLHAKSLQWQYRREPN